MAEGGWPNKPLQQTGPASRLVSGLGFAAVAAPGPVRAGRWRRTANAEVVAVGGQGLEAGGARVAGVGAGHGLVFAQVEGENRADGGRRGGSGKRRWGEGG